MAGPSKWQEKQERGKGWQFNHPSYYNGEAWQSASFSSDDASDSSIQHVLLRHKGGPRACGSEWLQVRGLQSLACVLLFQRKREAR